MKLLLLGMNHRTAPLALREHFAVEDAWRPALAKLVDGEVIAEAVLLSTCNRVEVVVLTPRARTSARQRLRAFFERELGRGALPRPASSSPTRSTSYAAPTRCATCFRVAASIDSMVVGEPQILGQVKDAYRAAVEGGACGSVLDAALPARLRRRQARAHRDARSPSGPVSVARVAVDLAAADLREPRGQDARC